MNQQYEHEGQKLNKPIIRAILRKCLVDPEVHRTINPHLKSLTISRWRENIYQYHEKNGGAPIQLLERHAPFYGALRELERQGSAERYRSSGEDFWKLIPCYEDNTPVRTLLSVIQQERERLSAEIETLRQRIAQLDAILNEYE